MKFHIFCGPTGFTLYKYLILNGESLLHSRSTDRAIVLQRADCDFSNFLCRTLQFFYRHIGLSVIDVD